MAGVLINGEHVDIDTWTGRRPGGDKGGTGENATEASEHQIWPVNEKLEERHGTDLPFRALRRKSPCRHVDLGSYWITAPKQ